MGEYKGQKVAVKMVTPEAPDILNCVKKYYPLPNMTGPQARTDKNHKCFTMSNMKLMKEILLISQLDHPGIIRLLGYCVKSEETPFGSDISQHGLSAVYEVAVKYQTNRMWSFKKKLQIVIDLADLFDYLEHSPMGSLKMSDLKAENFMMVDGHIKITDYDDISSEELRCGLKADNRTCQYGIKCDNGKCPGENARSNMVNGYNVFFRSLMKCTEENVCKEVTALRDTHSFNISAREFKEKLKDIFGKF
jgi:protein kinase domain-containing protein